MYLSIATIRKLYPLLQLEESNEQRSARTKAGQEMTTALLTFLALDEVQRFQGGGVANLSPKGGAESQRQALKKAYLRLALLSLPTEKTELRVMDLGWASEAPSGRPLATVFSSNVLTVPVKKGNMQEEPYDYPAPGRGRRVRPILKFGVGTGKWGADKHPNWKDNIWTFFTDRRCSDDLLPLVVFLLREEDLGQIHTTDDLRESVESALRARFTQEMADFLISHSDISAPNVSDRLELAAERPHMDYREFLKEPGRVLAASSSRKALGSDFWPDAQSVELPFAFPDSLIQRVLASLKSGFHVILYGPPGTGKTTLAEYITRACVKERYVTFTATSDWTTFEVIGGYMPDPAQPGRLAFVPGMITSCIDDDSWVIIDEINRADVDKAFGELFTLLSGKDVALPYEVDEPGDSGHRKRVLLKCSSRECDDSKYRCYRLPSRWRIIGTMNTLDKASLYQLSYAFMRRFAFIEVPAPDAYEMGEIIDRDLIPREAKLQEKYEDFWETVLYYLKQVFADQDTGLQAAGFPVGAAIPLSILRYVSERFAMTLPGEFPDATEIFIDALESFLFPQFEGHRRQSSDLVQMLVGALGLKAESPDATRISSSVMLWTGSGGM
jgi:MoxR-like ATPase